MLGRSIGFTRWYDRVPELSQAVRMMEKLPPSQQHLIASVIVGSLQLHQMSQRTDQGVKRLGTEKVMGLMKSKGKRRWYDIDPMVHQAFNYMYLMSDQMRYETALKIIVSIKALEVANQKGHPSKTHMTLVKGIFNEQLHNLLDKTEVMVREKTGETRAVLPEPSSDPAVGITPADQSISAIDTSAEGMKIIRLNKNR